MTQEYQYPATRTLYREEIKKSTFIVHIAHTPTIADAKAFVRSINEEYPDARHNCWAHVAGEPGGSHVLGFSDDGEPNGTAGKPMLNVLMGPGVGEISAVITRYFGGIKLGSGGLVRAYAQATKDVLAIAEGVPYIPTTTVALICAFEQEGWLRNQAIKYNVVLNEFVYTDQVQCVASIPDSVLTSFVQNCQAQQIQIHQA